MFKGQPQARTQSGKTLERCKSKGNIDNMVVIDVDEGKIDLVIDDAPETSCQKSRCVRATRRNSYPSSCVIISIDDAEDVDDARRNMHGNARFCPASSNSPSEESDTEEYLNVGKAKFASKLTQNIRMYPKSGCSRNSYGLNVVSGSGTSESDSSEFDISESESFESDSSDCEIMEDPSGNIRKQWEKAASMKKKSERCQFGPENLASASRSSANPGLSLHDTTQEKVDVDNCLNKPHMENFEVPFQSHPSSPNKENLSTSMATADGPTEDPPLKSKGNKSVAESDPIAGISHEGLVFQEEELISDKSSHRSQSPCTPFFPRKSGYKDQETPVQGPSLCSSLLPHDVDIDRVSFRVEDEQIPGENFMCTSELLGETSSQDKKGPCAARSSSCKPHPCDENKVFHENAGFWDNKKQVPGEPSCHTQPQHDSDVHHEIAGLQKKEKLISGDLSLCNSRPTCNPQTGNGTPENSLSLYTGNEEICQVQNDLIGDREKHKESDEYRRAVDEEWASRQQQLQIQAEEAQRLRKRRKAESLRLLDMKQRQKQRLEEMRESQKKDEETISLKEQLRAEVRKELDKLEMKFRDMASLLRGLGIHVEGGLFPMSHEVNAAYKQALLRFHPDRASRADIRQQVEAEETFKLISRLREKLLSVA